MRIAQFVQEQGEVDQVDDFDKTRNHEFLSLLLVLAILVFFFLYRKKILHALFFGRSASENRVGTLHGKLFRYGTKNTQIAFQSGKYSRHLVLVPGLTCGMLSLPYTETLAAALDRKKWSLVQPLTSSSFEGYGTGSLNRDASELRDLFAYLKSYRSCSEVVLMGHSTGTQDAVRFMKLYGQAKHLPKIKGIVLQASVSDQEYLETLPETKGRIDLASKMVSEGKSEEIAFRGYAKSGSVPLTARRFLALAQRYGDDDTFSSYFSDDDFKERLGHMDGTNCLVVFSGADEYVPKHVDKEALCKRFVNAMGSKSKYHIIEGGTHYLPEKQDEISQLVVDFLSSI